MAAEAEASREARAKVIAADGEMRASKALREASNIIDESPSALQLRYLQVYLIFVILHQKCNFIWYRHITKNASLILSLQTLNSIAAEKNSTIIFPVPIDFVSQFANSKNNRQQHRETTHSAQSTLTKPDDLPSKKQI